MTVARVSQVVAETLRTNTAVKARTSQVVVEALRINTATVIRASQIVVEVLRPNAALSVTISPAVEVDTGMPLSITISGPAAVYGLPWLRRRRR